MDPPYPIIFGLEIRRGDMKNQSLQNKAFQKVLAGHPIQCFFIPEEDEEYYDDEPEDPDMFPWPGAQNVVVIRVPEVSRFIEPLIF